eukprot:1152275-Pelagomonas_calceolata.AAC.5
MGFKVHRAHRKAGACVPGGLDGESGRRPPLEGRTYSAHEGGWRVVQLKPVLPEQDNSLRKPGHQPQLKGRVCSAHGGGWRVVQLRPVLPGRGGLVTRSL